jgi:hypothetical protein
MAVVVSGSSALVAAGLGSVWRVSRPGPGFSSVAAEHAGIGRAVIAFHRYLLV